MDLDIRTEKNAHSIVVHIKGEVDLYSSQEVRKVLLDVLKRKPPLILINLEGVRYMDSSGVATLIEGLQQSKKTKSRFVLFGLHDNVREVFELTRLDKIFEIHKDRESAISAATV